MKRLTVVRRAGGLGFLTIDGLGSRNYMLQLTLNLSQWMGVKMQKHICWVWSMGCDAVFKSARKNKEECSNNDVCSSIHCQETLKISVKL